VTWHCCLRSDAAADMAQPGVCARITAVAALALASCANSGPITTPYDGMWSAHIIAPANCAGAHYWRADFAIYNGKIRGWQVVLEDPGGRYIIGTVSRDGTVRAYTTAGPQGLGLRPMDMEFNGDTVTLKGASQCSEHTVWAGTRTGPVPWWQVSSI
jgi:hypothetical protein